MRRSVVGLLAGLGAGLSALVGLVHGGPVLIVLPCAALCAGLAAFAAAPSGKKDIDPLVPAGLAASAAASFEKKYISPLVPADLGNGPSDLERRIFNRMAA
jgi:hypothetical protein